MNISNEEISVNKNMVDIRISAKDGFNVGMENNNFVILDTTLTEDLILEGIAREMISKIQNMRKEKDFNVVDRITLYYNGDEEIEKCIKEYGEYIKKETLSLELIKKDNLEEKFDLNGHETYLDIRRND